MSEQSGGLGAPTPDPGPRPPGPNGHWWADAPVWPPPPPVARAFVPPPTRRPHRAAAPVARLPWPVVLLVAAVTGLVGGVVGALSVGQSQPPVPAAESSLSLDAAPAPLPRGGSVAGVASATLPSVVQITVDGGGLEATGSGFVLDRAGHVLTNNHVIAEAIEASEDGRIIVVFDDETRVSASVVGRSPAYDIAVLEVQRPTGHRPAAPADLDQVRVGDTVVAIGAPLGLSRTVTSGIVSAVDRPVTVGGQGEVSYINAIQTDAAINPGNSGGPLVNLRGEVVGVNSAIATLGGPFGTGTGSIGVGFAIPIDQVLRTAEQILRSGEASYPVMGASVDVNSEGNGGRLMTVTEDSPAADAGLRDGDVVTRIDGDVIEDGIELIVAIRSHLPGDVVTLVYRRGGDVDTVRVRLGEEVG
ncbi:MAG TPA: trypsin-like peptidase domain-containing protein [Nocardioidaceae bacterium]|nr:trypsin-like peptidase domain-containing protein [Nocardioidaceae bacterium]